MQHDYYIAIITQDINSKPTRELIDPETYKEWSQLKGASIEGVRVCNCCGEPIKEPGQDRALSNFKHIEPKSEEVCPKSFAASVHWDPLFTHNHFDAREIGRNRMTWEQWKSRNSGKINGIIHTLEGRHPTENKKALIAALFRKNETMIMPLTGLDPDFALATIFEGMGRLHVVWPSGRDIPVQFKWVGQNRTFTVKDVDGDEFKQYAPGDKVVLYIDGNRNKPFIPYGSKHPIYIRVFPEPTPDPRTSIARDQRKVSDYPGP